MKGQLKTTHQQHPAYHQSHSLQFQLGQPIHADNNLKNTHNKKQQVQLNNQNDILKQKEISMQSLQEKIHELNLQNQKLKDSVLFYKNKWQIQKQEKQIYHQKWRKSQSQRLELLKEYKQLLDYIDQKNHQQQMKIEVNVAPKKQLKIEQVIQTKENGSHILIQKPLIQESNTQNNLNIEKSGGHNDMIRKDTTISNANNNSMQSDLILQYILKKKLETKISCQINKGTKQHDDQTLVESIQVPMINNKNINQQNRILNQQHEHEKKLMTLKEANQVQGNMINVGSNTSIGNNGVLNRKISIPIKQVQKRKNYFEKKKQGN